jgi:hypothetical protein
MPIKVALLNMTRQELREEHTFDPMPRSDNIRRP